MRGLFLGQQAQEHRNEAVNSIRVLTVSGLETVDGKGVKRSESQRMPIDK